MMLRVLSALLLAASVAAMPSLGGMHHNDVLGYMEYIRGGGAEARMESTLVLEPTVSKLAYVEDRASSRLHSRHARHLDWHSLWSWRSIVDLMEGFYGSEVASIGG